jgi:hypothetical protein
VEDRWCSPEPQGLRSEVEDEENNRYINNILSGDLEVKGENPEPAKSCTEAREAEALSPQGQEAVNEVPKEVGGEHQECVAGSQPPAMRKPKRRMPRKKVVCDEQETWETARRDAWLRELLTDSSGDESEGGCSRF